MQVTSCTMLDSRHLHFPFQSWYLLSSLSIALMWVIIIYSSCVMISIHRLCNTYCEAWWLKLEHKRLSHIIEPCLFWTYLIFFIQMKYYENLHAEFQFMGGMDLNCNHAGQYTPFGVVNHLKSLNWIRNFQFS